MKTQNRYWLFVFISLGVTALVLISIALSFWQQVAVDQKEVLFDIFKEQFGYIFIALTFLFTLFGFGLDWFFRFYIVPVNQLADETELIYTVNPSLRIELNGSHDVMRLTEIINQSAQRQTEFRQSIENKLNSAKAETENERNMLAALLEDLPVGILICNLKGRIVFYNRTIKSLLAQHPPLSISKSSQEDIHYIGLGRSIYGIIDQALVDRCLERIGNKIAQGLPAANERFLVGTRSSGMLPAEIIPVLQSQHHLTGFIVTIEDQVANFQHEKEISTQLENWQHQMTQSVAVIKTIAEVLKDHPPSAQEDHQQLMHILAEKAGLAADLLNQSEVTASWSRAQPLPLTQIELMEWVHFLIFRIKELAGVDIETKSIPLKVMISIDMHHLTSAFAYLFQKIRAGHDVENVHLQLRQTDGWIYVDFFWTGEKVTLSLLNQWITSVPQIKEATITNSLEEILEYHGAKLWPGFPTLPDGYGGLRLLLPVVEGADTFQTNGQAKVLSDARPEFYDFDLFRQAGQTADLDEQPLTKLTYTVFDTETTGLDPNSGDEIISIGAVRIVNGSLLREDYFDQLIDPRRSLPWTSVKYHGIRREMLENQPHIEQVLPRFFQFTQDTILVGHNVAFDMRMLQVKEEQTKICFENPVLDTLLLSAAVHPAHTKHTLKTIAHRLGVSVDHRHTALGDAITTGRIFLMLLPILANKGILTLGQARRASEKTYYARLKY